MIKFALQKIKIKISFSSKRHIPISLKQTLKQIVASNYPLLSLALVEFEDLR